LNLRPHPYQLNAGNRCAHRPFPRSRSTVRAKGIGSIGPLVCVHLWVALIGAGQRTSCAGGIPPVTADPVRAGGWPRAVVLTDTGMADNRGRPKGGVMPRLDDTAVEEGRQHRPVGSVRATRSSRPSRAPTSPRRWCSSTRSPQRPRRPDTIRHRHPLEQGHPSPTQPRRGWPDRP
jgi:hypothetical protein